MRRFFVTGVLAIMIAGTALQPSAPALAQQAAAIPSDQPLIAHMLPVAAGALAGGAAGFFFLPLLVPSIATVAAVGPPTSPLFGMLGAGLGGFLGWAKFDNY